MIRPVIRMAALCVLSCTVSARADWSRFRGPNGSGINTDSRALPDAWSPSANVKWKTALPGAGVSCPIVVGDRVYVTCYSGYGLDRENPGDINKLKRHLVSVDRNSGSILWNKTINAVQPEDPFRGPGVPTHGYASNTPVSDGENIYVFFSKSGVLAFDKSGKQLWRTSVGKESDPQRWGSASSPILYKNLLIVPAFAESEALVALDKTTGKEVWRQEASGFSNSWSTPILVKVDKDRTDLVVGVTAEIWGFNPDTGKLRWYCDGAKSRSYCSSVIAEDGVVYAIEGQSGKAMAVRAGGKGNVTDTHLLWTGRDSARFGAPIEYKNRIYSFANGVCTTLDAKTGEKIHQARLAGGQRGGGGGMGGDFASPVFADGKLYYLRNSGDLFVMKADDKLEQLAINRVTADSELFAATPAISNGELFLRSNKHLYCVAPMGKTVPPEEKVAMTSAQPDDDDEAAGDRGGPGRGRGGRGRERGGRGRFDPAEFFKQRDANGDGKLSGDEIPGRMRDGMDDIDADKDGAITLDEFRNARGRMFGGRGRGRGGRGGPRGESGESRPKRPERPPLET